MHGVLQSLALKYPNNRNAQQVASLDCQGGAALANWNFVLPWQLMSMAFCSQNKE